MLVSHLNEHNPLDIIHDVAAGRVEKPEHAATKDKTTLKDTTNKTPSTPRNQQKRRPISKKNKLRIKAAREYLASGELASEDLERRKERDLRTLYVRYLHRWRYLLVRGFWQ